MNSPEIMTLIISSALLVATIFGLKLHYGSRCLIPQLGATIELNYPRSPTKSQSKEPEVEPIQETSISINDVIEEAKEVKEVVDVIKSVV
jgi:hypothetical protein